MLIAVKPRRVVAVVRIRLARQDISSKTCYFACAAEPVRLLLHYTTATGKHSLPLHFHSLRKTATT